MTTSGSRTLYAAASGADAIVAINTESVTETARYSTGAGTEPMYLAAAGGKIWFGYGFIVEDMTFSPDGSRLLIVSHGRQVDSWLTADLSESTSYTMGVGQAGVPAAASTSSSPATASPRSRWPAHTTRT